MHTKRTGHTDFVDKTSEAAKPITLEAPKAADGSEDSGQPQGTISVYVLLLHAGFDSNFYS